MKPKDVLQPCPFCGSSNTTLDYYEISCPQELGTIVVCNDCGASATSIVDWNTRPIEDALNARIAELEAENERLSQLLHDEMSQLEIATDLGNKRWTALNKIYEHGEKHNTNWCKRIAQEGLGIK
jgi:hypothetical protein